MKKIPFLEKDEFVSKNPDYTMSNVGLMLLVCKMRFCKTNDVLKQ
jgi:hypothetical protein